MELVERYLQAVRFWLPREQKDDIIAELSEDIHAQIEEQETSLGRSLSGGEVETILKQRGRPMLVANRYLPQRHLIGPVLFPIYSFVLKIVFLCYLIPWLLVTISFMTFDQRLTLATVSRSLWSTAFIALSTVTIVFAVLERVQQANSHFLEDWDPRKLPPVRHYNLIKRSSSAFELAANLIFAIWFLTYLWSPITLFHSAAQVTLAPLWPNFFWGYMCLTIANTALSAANLIRPYWTTSRATVRLLFDFIGGALFCWLLEANIVAQIVAQSIPTDKATRLTDAINLWMARMEPIAVIVVIIVLAVDVFRITRLRTQKVQLPWQATVTP